MPQGKHHMSLPRRIITVASYGIALTLTVFWLLIFRGPPAAAESYRYDAAGRLQSVTYDSGATTTYVYDANGNLLSMTHTEPPPNQPPTAASATIVTDEDTPSTPVSAEISDPDIGDQHILTLDTQPAHGTATIVGNQLVYTPNANFHGNDAFTFLATDAGGSTIQGTATVTVRPINDAPTASVDALTVARDTTVSASIQVVDVDTGDTHMFAISSSGTLGTASVDANGVLTYTAGSVAGSDQVDIVVTDTGGLSTTVTAAITILPPEPLDSNGDGLSDSQAEALGLDPTIAGGDSDGDGITDVDELGDPSAPLDQDGDGVIDALEIGDAATNATVLQFQLTAPTAERLQLSSLAAQPITLTATGATALIAINNRGVGVPIYNEADMPRNDSEFDYPLGLFRLRLTVTPGGSATLTIRFPLSAELPVDAVYRKVNDTGVYRTLDNAVIDTANRMITLSLTDGGDGDEDGLANGVIVDPSGVAVPESESDNGFCFIATVAYGSYEAPYVQVLRQFRDRYLLTHKMGRWAVTQYYAYSPPLAAWIADRDTWRRVARILLLPFIGFAWVSLHAPLALFAGATLMVTMCVSRLMQNHPRHARFREHIHHRSMG